MTVSPRENAPSADRAWAYDAVRDVSRTFALTVDLLEEPVSSWVCTGYLLCRIADTVEDDPTIPPRRRASILETYAAALDPGTETDVEEFMTAVEPVRPDEASADWAVVDRTDRAVNVFESFDREVQDAMRSVVREMALGMAAFLRRHADSGGLRLETVEELEEYCWYVAGTVGELFTNLLGCHTAEPDPDPEDARSFALLLQLVNIAKDVRADREAENNVYLPGEWLAAEGVTHAAVGDPDSVAAVTRVVERVVDHAADHADGARRYLGTLPENEVGLLRSMGLPYLLALGTIRELRGRATEAVTRVDAVKLDRDEVEALYAEVEDGVTQAELTRLAEIVRERPYPSDAPRQ